MKNRNISSVFERYNQIEKNIENLKIFENLVSFTQLKEIFNKYRFCKNILLENEDFFSWQNKFILPITNYLFQRTNSPIPFNFESESVKKINLEPPIMNLCEKLDNESKDVVNDLIYSLDLISNIEENPFLENINLTNLDLENELFVVPDFKCLQISERYLDQRDMRINFITPKKILFDEKFGLNMFLFGSLYNYSDDLLTSPLVSRISHFSYDFFKNPNGIRSFISYLDKDLLDKYIVKWNSVNHVQVQTSLPNLENSHYEKEKKYSNVIDPSILDNDDFYEKIENFFISTISSKGENVDAVCLELIDNKRIYINSSENLKHTIIKINSSNDFTPEVKEVGISDISSGDYIIIRTQSDKDYLRDIVDMILGDQKEKYRDSLKQWKRSLEILTEQIGPNGVIKNLIMNGSKIANIINLKNWISIESYGPKDYLEFEGIMKLLGAKEKEIIQKWNIIRQLRNASIEAGKKVKSTVEQKILDSNLDEILLSGQYEFIFDELDEIFTAFLIERKHQKRMIDSNNINRVFDLNSSFEGVLNENDSL